MESTAEIKLYRELSNGAEHKLSVDEVNELGQPGYPGLTIFKVFRYLLRFIEGVESRGNRIDSDLLTRIEALEKAKK
jgi:hypothetical protein